MGGDKPIADETKRKARRAAYMRDWRKRRRAAGIRKSEESEIFWEQFRTMIRRAVRDEFELCMSELRAELRAELAAKNPNNPA